MGLAFLSYDISDSVGTELRKFSVTMCLFAYREQDLIKLCAAPLRSIPDSALMK